MSEMTDRARDAVAERAAELASSADAEQLKVLAEAVAQIHFGPQGADYNNYTQYHHDHHETHHAVERSQAGFGNVPVVS